MGNCLKNVIIGELQKHWWKWFAKRIRQRRRKPTAYIYIFPIYPKFALFRSISYCFRDKCNFRFFEILRKCCVVFIDNAVIPNLYPFRSISYRFWDKPFLHKNSRIGSFFKISDPWPWSIEPLLWKGTPSQHRQYCCKVWRWLTL